MAEIKRVVIGFAVAGVFLVCAQVMYGAQERDAHSWDAVCLSNRYVSLQIVPAIGGRVMRYALGGKNFLWVNPGLEGRNPPPEGVGPDNAWLNYGGDKLWPAPQGWDNDKQWPGPPDAVLDGGPHKLERLPDAGTARSVRVTSREDKRSGIQFSRVIRLQEGSTHVHFEATMRNIDNKPRRWGIWSHTQLDGGRTGGGHNPEMKAWCPLNPKSHFTNGYTVIFGDAKNPSFQADAAHGLMRVQYQYKVGKIGLDSKAGWVATMDGSDGRVFVQQFAFEPGKEYPDGSSVEFWLNGTGSFRAWGKDNVMPADPEKNPYIFESELLSPFAELQPGESYTWSYDWYAANIGPGAHEVTGITATGVVSEPLRTLSTGGQFRVSGRFGVFAAGRLALHVLDGQRKALVREVLCETVSPLTPVVLDRQMALPDGAKSVRLVFINMAGNEEGELGEGPLERSASATVRKSSIEDQSIDAKFRR